MNLTGKIEKNFFCLRENSSIYLSLSPLQQIASFFGHGGRKENCAVQWFFIFIALYAILENRFDLRKNFNFSSSFLKVLL